VTSVLHKYKGIGISSPVPFFIHSEVEIIEKDLIHSDNQRVTIAFFCAKYGE
jgi:hypothetical protein